METKLIHYLMIAKHLPGDSELLFFETADEAKAEFDKRYNKILEEKPDIEAGIDYHREDEYDIQFDGNLESLSGIDHRFVVGTQDVPAYCTHYVAEFSESVFDSYVKFFNIEDAKVDWNDKLEESIKIISDKTKCPINRYDQKTWEDEEGTTLFHEHHSEEYSEAYFNDAHFYYAYRIGEIEINP